MDFLCNCTGAVTVVLWLRSGNPLSISRGSKPCKKKDKDPYYSRGGMLLLYRGGRQKKKIGLKDWRPQLSELFVSKHDESNSVELTTVRFVAEAVKEAQTSGPPY